jgi:hypothetical protein
MVSGVRSSMPIGQYLGSKGLRILLLRRYDREDIDGAPGETTHGEAMIQLQVHHCIHTECLTMLSRPSKVWMISPK